MRLMAWNVNHRAQARKIPEELAPAILALRPDLLVLTEYVEGKAHEPFVERLSAGGLAHYVHTPAARGYNQVLVAARRPISPVAFPVPQEIEHGAANLIVVRSPATGIDIMGIRVPFYVKAGDARSYWDWFEQAIAPLQSRRFIIIGDLNADPDRPRGRGTAHLERLVTKGWQLPRPAGNPWSYRSSTGKMSRVDHVLLAPGLKCGRVEYVIPRLEGESGPLLSDHAALLVELSATAPLIST